MHTATYCLVTRHAAAVPGGQGGGRRRAFTTPHAELIRTLCCMYVLLHVNVPDAFHAHACGVSAVIAKTVE
eukprot:58503-Chlamydomonas_euryale.AAC.6